MEAIWKSSNNERLSIWNGSFAIISMNIVNNFIAMYLLDGLNATNNEMGLLNSLPSLVNLGAMMAAAIMIAKTESKKWFCVIATIISRSFYIWIAVVPFFGFHDMALWVVWLVALTRLPQSFGDVSWQALIGDLILPERRSVFFSERNRVTAIVGLFATFLTGLLLQQFDKHLLMPYQLVFIATSIFAFLEIWLLIRHDETGLVKFTQKAHPDARHGRRRPGAWGRMFRDKQFCVSGFALLFFNFGWQLAWPLFNIYQISTAHAPALWLALFQVANAVSQIASFRWWGRMADKYGNAKMLAVAAVGMASAPILTIVSTNLYYLLILNIFTGIPLAGTVLLLFNHLLEISPEDARTSYIANYNVLLSVIGFVAPELGIWLLNTFDMNIGMTISTLLRFLGGVVFFFAARYMMKRHWGSRQDTLPM